MDAYLPERVALTGATGALGFAFLRRYFQRSLVSSATLLVRQASSSFQTPEFQSWLLKHEKRLTLIEGDVRHLEKSQLEALLTCDGGLWHFAAVTSLTAESEEVARAIREVNFEATQRLVEAGLHLRTTCPFYHISTAYVVGRRQGIALESENKVGQEFRNPYEASKLAAETSVLKAFADGLPGLIFRPSVVVDDAGGTGGIKMVDACAYSVALAVKRREPFVFRQKPTAHLNMIHTDWVIAAMLDLARMPSGPGCTYHLTAPRDTYFADIAAILERVKPDLKVNFEPEAQRSDLPSASKIFDKAVTEIRQYLDSDIGFDRANTDRDLSPNVKETPLALASFVENRLRSEIERIAHRR